jgi:dienelactone hydrolase
MVIKAPHVLTRFSLLLVLLFCSYTARCRQQPLNNDSYLTWTTLSPTYGLRDDGRLLWYQYGSPATGDVLVLQAPDNHFHREYCEAFNPTFAGKRFLFQLPGDTLVIQTEDSTAYLPGVVTYHIYNDQLLLQTAATLIWKDLESGHTHTLLANALNALAFDGRQLAFIDGGTLRYYRPGMDTATVLRDSCIGPLQFSRDGQRISFQLLPATSPPPPETKKIWHYRDYYLQVPTPTPVTMVMDHNTKKQVRLNIPGTEIAYQHGGRYIITQNSLNHQEYYWNKTVISTLYLLDTHTGERKTIAANKDKLLLQPKLSPNEGFVSWYDLQTQYTRCYEIATGRIRDLVKGIGDVQWAGDSLLFVHTEQDVWQVDPFANKPLKITAGKKRHMTFRWLFPGILTAFHHKTKQNGFWTWQQGKLRPRTMDDCLYYMPQYPLDQYKPVKARDTTLYLLVRMQATSAPNLLLTSDFIHFTPITNIQPQARYNWLTVTLTKHGLLYKPANFDPQRKYPVIFHYYEGSKDYLHRYLPPALSEGTLNIPTYVSNGYIVFVPHIQIKKGRPGKSAAKAVMRSARYMAAFPWVDDTRMGLQGHSFGGYVTHYVITHARSFAAAQASAGPADFLSGYGAVRKITGTAMQQLYETGQNKMGVPPWDRPRLYMKNSPVVRVNRIHTPLLMMHNDNDNAVPFAQGIALFTALRRLQKPAWLIQYKGEGHQLYKEPQQLDFSIRQRQFFDHYLKGQPMPDWMKSY